MGDTVEVLITGVSEEDDDQEYIIASRKEKSKLKRTGKNRRLFQK